MINILILSAGTRNKVVQYFRKELAGRGKVYATDCSELAPAVYEADEAILVPRMTEPGYLETILDICREKKITGVFSLIDPELTLLGGTPGGISCGGNHSDHFFSGSGGSFF